MKTLVITGGSRGIGLATAKLFAAAGYRVLNVSRSPIDLEGSVHIAIDIADPRWPEHHAERLCAHFEPGSEIALVHNAGTLTKDSVVTLEAAALHRVLQVNVVAAVQLNQLLLPFMGAGSSIIYVGSTLGEKAVAGACAYVTSKHAQIGLMRSTCQDLAGSGIHTACVCPGFTDTEMLRAHVGHSPEILMALAAAVTCGRLIEPEEIARTIRFCADNPVINGAVLHANLGQIEH